MAGTLTSAFAMARFAAFALAVAGTGVGCILDSSGRGTAGSGGLGGAGGGGAGGATSCTSIGCEDGNPCTEDVCSPDGTCSHSPAGAGPDDGNECTDDTCEGTQEQHDPRPDGDPCGLGGLLQCAGGKCNCQAAAECGETTACVTFRCERDACLSESEPKGTLVDGAGQQDCKHHVCDGAGQIALEVDEADAPEDDGNDCTIEACEEGVPVVHAPAADGAPCGPASSCAQSESGFEAVPQPACLAGACSAPPPIFCGLFACDATNTECRSTCSTDAHCVSMAFCAGTTCVPTLPSGSACSTDSQCETTFCTDGVCCNSACDGTCLTCASGGLVGVCLPLAGGTDPDAECAGALSCDGTGSCQKANGDPCLIDAECQAGFCEDGYCCAGACAGSCKRCDLPGVLGTCTDVPAGMQAGQCTDANEQCDGAGNCKVTNGTPCADGSDCLSGFCSSEPNAQKVCCNQACGGVCQSCRAEKTGGVTGVCGSIPDKTDPDLECPGQCQLNGSGCCNGDGTCQP